MADEVVDGDGDEEGGEGDEHDEERVTRVEILCREDISIAHSLKRSRGINVLFEAVEAHGSPHRQSLYGEVDCIEVTPPLRIFKEQGTHQKAHKDSEN